MHNFISLILNIDLKIYLIKRVAESARITNEILENNPLNSTRKEFYLAAKNLKTNAVSNL
jgi:hypothetical protein